MSVMKIVKERDESIDLLRFIGLSLIILAHVSPPEVLFNLRCFDVPLMLFVSGLTYAGRSVDTSWRFFVHRFMRLIIPVYLFLTVYFMLVFLLKKFFSIDFGITPQHVIGSYLLMDGIGYVWIIRVFLVVSILTPWLIRLNEVVKKEVYFFFLILVVITIQEVLIGFGVGMSITFFREFVYYAVGYSVLFLFGLRIKSITYKQEKFYFVSFLISFFIYIIFIISKLNGIEEVKLLLLINNYKYPPRLYFLFYGLIMSIISFAIIRWSSSFWKGKNFLLFIGQNTIWIYLYHIPLIQITGLIGVSWYVRYFVVYLLAVSIVWFQIDIVKSIEQKHKYVFLKYLKG